MEDISLVIRRCKRSNDVKLSLASKMLMSIPNDVYQLTGLQHLDLSNNKLISLDASVGNLKSLRILDLSSNSLLELPQSLLKLESLQQLMVSNNPLVRQFEHLLDPANQTQPNLRSALLRAFNQEEQGVLQNFSGYQDFESRSPEELKRNDSLSRQISGGTNSSKFGGVMEIDANEFEIKEIISQGGFSIVHRALLRGTEVALKKIFNPNITQDLLDETNNEIEMLASLRHPNIILLMGVTTKPPNLFIATEFMPKGSLFALLHKTKTAIKDSSKLNLATQICQVLLYLHKSGIVHRDIKSHNILLDESYKVKLCDFGLARKMTDLNQGTMQFSGTPAYMAPELFQKKAYDKAVDSFAFGTMLWEIFAREVPFEGIDPQDVQTKVLRGEPLQIKSVPRPIMNLVNELRQSDPGKRPSFDIILTELRKLSF